MKTVIKNDTAITNHPHQGNVILDVDPDVVIGEDVILDPGIVVEL